MKRPFDKTAAVLLGTVALLLVPVVAQGSDFWIDKIENEILAMRETATHQGLERTFEPYVAQIHNIREAFLVGNHELVRTRMNRLMDMLEAREHGMPGYAAKNVFDFCGKVTPAGYHDAERHKPGKTDGGLDYWDDYMFDPGA